MYLYTETKEKFKFNTSKINKIGGQVHGNIFRISDTECLKVYKSNDTIDIEIFKLLKKLTLPNFYKIYNLYYNRNGTFKAHTMKYYEPKEIDILTEKTEYTTNNLYNLFKTVTILNQNNILINDTHSENVILDSEKITIIDADLYTINRFFKKLSLEIHNINALRYLIESLYLCALKQYHPQYYNEDTIAIIKNTFNLYGSLNVQNTIRELSEYKYPIDYIKKKVR